MRSDHLTTSIHWSKARFLCSLGQMEQFPETGLAEIAVAGHSNVGKSSLLNALVGRKRLVKTSKAPGCTRLINLFDVDGRFLLVDLPGYGYARVPKKELERWRRLIESYLLHASRLRLVLLLLDIRHGPKASDQQLIAWLNHHGIRWLPVATKADKLTGNRRAKRLKEMTEMLGGMLTPLPTSSHDGRGIDVLRRMIEQELRIG